MQDHINALCEGHDARLAAVDDLAKLARGRFLELLDLDLDSPRTAPTVRPAGTLEFADYWIEKVVIEAAAGVPIPCTVYVPRSVPRSAVFLPRPPS